MKSPQPGKRTSGAEVTNVSPHGLWILVDDNEVFASFNDFPWFRDASIAELTHVERPSAHHLYWPALDIDLAVESLSRPEAYPLVSKGQPSTTRARAAAVREAKDTRSRG